MRIIKSVAVCGLILGAYFIGLEEQKSTCFDRMHDISVKVAINACKQHLKAKKEGWAGEYMAYYVNGDKQQVKYTGCKVVDLKPIGER